MKRYLLLALVFTLSACSAKIEYVPVGAKLQIPKEVLQPTPTYAKVEGTTMSEQDILSYMTNLFNIVDRLARDKQTLIDAINLYNEAIDGTNN